MTTLMLIVGIVTTTVVCSWAATVFVRRYIDNHRAQVRHEDGEHLAALIDRITANGLVIDRLENELRSAR